LLVAVVIGGCFHGVRISLESRFLVGILFPYGMDKVLWISKVQRNFLWYAMTVCFEIKGPQKREFAQTRSTEKIWSVVSKTMSFLRQRTKSVETTEFVFRIIRRILKRIIRIFRKWRKSKTSTILNTTFLSFFRTIPIFLWIDSGMDECYNTPPSKAHGIVFPTFDLTLMSSS
jgi:hypothetical protein